MEKRPQLTKNISLKDFKEFYWLKKELVAFCRKENIPLSGSKMEIAGQIELYLKDGNKIPFSKPLKKSSSNFDWNKESLTLKTKITDNYKSSENVRSFFKKHLGESFKFNVKFMNWMKVNHGQTLKDAV